MTPIDCRGRMPLGAASCWGNASHPILRGVQGLHHKPCRNSSGTSVARYWTGVTTEATAFEARRRGCPQSSLGKKPVEDKFRNCANTLKMMQNDAKKGKCCRKGATWDGKRELDGLTAALSGRACQLSRHPPDAEARPEQHKRRPHKVLIPCEAF